RPVRPGRHSVSPGHRQAAGGLLHGPRAGAAARQLSAGAALVLRAAEDQPGRGYQRSLLLRQRDQGRPGEAARHSGSAVSQVCPDEQGAGAVLLQVRRAAYRSDAAVPPMRQDQSHGQPVLHSLWESTSLTKQLLVASCQLLATSTWQLATISMS